MTRHAGHEKERTAAHAASNRSSSNPRSSVLPPLSHRAPIDSLPPAHSRSSRRNLLLTLGLAACAASLMAAAPAAPDPAPGEAFTDFTTDGAWCWFSEPRAIQLQGDVYAGWVTAAGDIAVGRRRSADRLAETSTLHERFERDDHDHPALLALPDGRIAAFYSLHARGDMHLRVTTAPDSIAAWGPERELGFSAPDRGRRGTTYANPVLLAGENNALFLVWRGDDFKPTLAISRDLGRTWSTPRTLIARRGSDDTNRPYLKLRSDGIGRIDFAFTDGHPRDEPVNSLHYVRYERGAFWRADGTRLASLEELPLDPDRCDRVYDGATDGRAWVWDIARAPDGQPVIAFTKLPAENDHRYAAAEWTGSSWQLTEICKAGGWFPRTPADTTEREPHYSGGMALDPVHPRTLYTSRRIEGVFEIERWHRASADAAWVAEPVTTRSRRDNVRPVVLRASAQAGPTLLWMCNERYVHYTDYHSAIKVVTP